MIKNQALQAKSQPESIRLQMNSNSGWGVDFPYVGKPHVKKKKAISLPYQPKTLFVSLSYFIIVSFVFHPISQAFLKLPFKAN